MGSKPKTPSEDELIRTYVEHLGPVTVGTEFTRQEEARRGLAKIKADAWDELSNALEDEVSFSIADEYPNPYRTVKDN